MLASFRRINCPRFASIAVSSCCRCSHQRISCPIPLYSNMSTDPPPVVPAEAPDLGANGAKAEWPWKRAKKVACLVSFSGKDYMGMQRNTGFATIEEELMKAFLAGGAIPQDWYDCMQKSFFQRASRTDKGVSALKMIVSLKMLYDQEIISKINATLPPEIRLQDIKRVTKNFNSKSSCDARTYLYLMPTFAVCPIEEILSEEYRIDAETRKRTNEVLQLLVGSHYYHNYTAGKAPGLGLMLDEVHYDRYNKRFGSDGVHDALSWDHLSDQLESFKRDIIFEDIILSEKKEKSMLEWMKNLPIHTFTPRHFESMTPEQSPLAKAYRNISRDKKNADGEEETENPEDDEDNPKREEDGVELVPKHDLKV
eukprot:maker-scaffold916_size81488-snap-gene-0.6 protein:Tk11718 transcript:maker-scaffold916_size81488-snap-gene-0.6-mRNA-1 annotation:"unnamed protein product"